MSDDRDLGGDPPCWAHVLDRQPDDGHVRSGAVADRTEVVADGNGVVRSLPRGADLDANLVHLDPGAVIAAHRNDDVDVLIVVRSGVAELTIDTRPCQLVADLVVLIPRGTRRAVVAGPAGITYLSVYRRRGPLTVGASRDATADRTRS